MSDEISADAVPANVLGLTARIVSAHIGKNQVAVDELPALIEAIYRKKGPIGLVVRTIGLARAQVKIGLANLAYNMRRHVWLSRQAVPA